MSFSNKIKTFFISISIVLIGISLVGINKISAHQFAITNRQEAGRLGDNVYSYCLAKWFAYKYNIPFCATEFKQSDFFSIDKVDQSLNTDFKSTFTNVIDIKTEDELIEHLKNDKASTLFIVGMGTGSHFASTLVETLSWPGIYTNIFFYAIEHPSFGSELKKALTINKQVTETPLPSDKITVAVHVRKGSGGDGALSSVQYQDEWDRIIAQKISNPTFPRGADMFCPLRFPTEQFYVDQIIKLSNLLNNCPLFVYIFTDDKNPKQIIERFKKKIGRSNITFACRKDDTYDVDSNKQSLFEDIHAMSHFDCLIKPESGFALIAQLIGNHKIIIYPQDSATLIEPPLNQAYLLIDNVSIIFRDHNTNSAKFFSFNEITEEHKKHVLQLFNVFSSPCRDIPRSLYDGYTMSNNIPVTYLYRDDSYSDNNPIIYSKNEINSFISEAQQKKTHYYGATDTYLYQALEKYNAFVSNKNVAVLGSVTPWYESIVLAYGGLPTTIEYNKIISQDSRLNVMTVTEYDKNPQLFDVLVSISSFEHDGLGRYGDRLDPYGDIKAMQKAKTMLKKEGLLFLAVPIGQDSLVWNLHRIYGELRFPLLIAGWEIVDSFGFNTGDLQKKSDVGGSHQPIFVLRQR